MAASTGFDGYGVLLGIGDGASAEAFSSIAEVVDVAGPSWSKDTHEVSHATSPNKYKEYIAGFKDGGEVTASGNMTQSDYAALLVKFDSEGLNNYQITIPDSNFATKPTIVFAGHVTALETEYPTQGVVTFSLTLKISGKPVHTQGS